MVRLFSFSASDCKPDTGSRATANDSIDCYNYV
jgi:hypothetical protein